MIDRILRTEPVRLYSIGVAFFAVAAYFVPSGAWPLVIGLLAAILGLGEGARSQVFSRDTHEAQIDHLVTITAAMPDPDDIPTTGAPRGRDANGRFA